LYSISKINSQESNRKEFKMKSTVKWTKQKVVDVIKEARNAGSLAAQKKFSELNSIGPKYEVIQGNKVVGSMLDVCGFAHLKITARGKFYLLAKEISKENPQYRFSCNRSSYYGGGWLSIYDSTNRQEISVNVAACKGQQEVLAKYGITAQVESRID